MPPSWRESWASPPSWEPGPGTETLTDGTGVTVSCSEGDDGLVYRGILDYAIEETPLDRIPEIPVDLMLNVGVPDQAFALAQLPNHGVGLARLEFIINRAIGIHPRALAEFDTLPEPLKSEVAQQDRCLPVSARLLRAAGRGGRLDDRRRFAPKPVIVRMSDFKTNEYAGLLGGDLFEPHEENPMLGWRGASRYTTPSFRACFDMECEAMRHVRDRMGLTNLKIMIPFVRTVEEAAATIALLAENGLRRGENGLEVVMMCEIPSNALLGGRVPRPLRRILHRLERPDPADSRCGPRLRPGRRIVRRTGSRSARPAGTRHRSVHPARQVHRHLRARALGSSRPGGVAAGRGIGSMSLNADAIVETWLRLADASVVKV